MAGVYHPLSDRTVNSSGSSHMAMKVAHMIYGWIYKDRGVLSSKGIRQQAHRRTHGRLAMVCSGKGSAQKVPTWQLCNSIGQCSCHAETSCWLFQPYPKSPHRQVWSWGVCLPILPSRLTS